MAKKEEWVNPRLIDFTLSKWNNENSVTYLSFYNGVYVGCVVKPSDINYMDIAKAILDIEITNKMVSSRLSKRKCPVKDQLITFHISTRRVEVSYSLPGR